MSRNPKVKPNENDTRRTYRVQVAHKQALLALALVTLRYSAYNNGIERTSSNDVAS